MSQIEWTDHTWNPGVYGCRAVSPGCGRCYAARMAHRLTGMGVYPEGLTRRTPTGVHWTGTVVTSPIVERLDSLPRRRRVRVFVASMSDLFHRDVPSIFIRQVFMAMSERQHLTFQLLTKRPERARDWWRDWEREDPRQTWPHNVWMGTSVEDQRRAEERIPYLLEIPAAVRWLSCEPLLGPVDLRRLVARGVVVLDALEGRMGWPSPHALCAQIRWVVVGGESGPGARAVHPDWIRAIRDQCSEAGTAFFFKQWGGRSKKMTGRVLDGRLHDALPAGSHLRRLIERPRRMERPVWGRCSCVGGKRIQVSPDGCGETLCKHIPEGSCSGSP